MPTSQTQTHTNSPDLRDTHPTQTPLNQAPPPSPIQTICHDAIALLEASYPEDYRAIATYLFRRTGDHDLAGELASETYAKALASLHTWTNQGLPLRHWLLRIATRRLAHHRRARSRRARLLSLLRFSQPHTTQSPPDAPESHPILRAIAHLPPDRQDVLHLHHIEELTIEEVALTLDIPRGTVKSRLARARAELASYLPPPTPPTPPNTASTSPHIPGANP